MVRSIAGWSRYDERARRVLSTPRYSTRGPGAGAWKFRDGLVEKAPMDHIRDSGLSNGAPCRLPDLMADKCKQGLGSIPGVREQRPLSSISKDVLVPTYIGPLWGLIYLNSVIYP